MATMPTPTPSNSNSTVKKTMFLVAAAHLSCRHGAHAFHTVTKLPCLSHGASFAMTSHRPTQYLSPISFGGRRKNTANIHSFSSSFLALVPHQQFSFNTRLNEQNENNGSAEANDTNIDPTWTYVPYKPPPPPRKRKPRLNNNITRQFSTSPEWTIPDTIDIPQDQLQMSFTRSSGAGGQNVNKLSTKVELRFHLDSASWIPQEVRQRLKSNEANRINNEGFMLITSQEYRTQAQNRKDALKKLQDILKNSWERPKVRKMRKGLSKKTKENRREMKKMIGEKKASRKRVDF